ncbi:transglycosylase SLT domain-containing protein [Wenzhouxiangella sp. EGI_FJ10305]|uniref:transglycosylase SLT domain-containing protein n=1 Tax=Wenzhouxiangella sp. EGI_FJ10305 TaxID=3243768 RepID=UPI0035E08178
MNRMLAVFFLAFFAPAAWGQCTPQRVAVIEEEASARGLEPAYAVAIARTMSACRADYRDWAGRVGVLGVRPEIAALSEDCIHCRLLDPRANLRIGLDLIQDLFERHGDWETTLSVYYAGTERPNRRTQRWVQAVFRDAHRHCCPRELRPWRHSYPDLDDFGPRCRSPRQGACGPVGAWRPIADWR